MTKWPTAGSGQSKYGTGVVFREHEEHEVGSGHSKCGLGMVFLEEEEHEVAYSWLWAFKMWPG
eukprot:3521220-Pyramimonas_sp.AAC.1